MPLTGHHVPSAFDKNRQTAFIVIMAQGYVQVEKYHNATTSAGNYAVILGIFEWMLFSPL
jgi:hypothetical protein